MHDKPTVDPYRELFERSADANLIIAGDRFVDCNRATVEMLRYGSKEELLQTHPSELSPEHQPDGRLSYEKANEMMGIALERGSHRFEWAHKRADGEVFPVEVLLTAMPGDGRPILHTVWRDITERKLLETELRHAQKMEAIGKLAGGIAHDFNNLLVSIIGHSELIEMSLPAGDPLREQIVEVQKAGDRAAALVKQLLAFGRKQDLQPQLVDLNAVVDGLDQMLGRLIGEDVLLVMQPHASPLIVKADPGQLEQVVLNLVTNGREAMPGGGTLTIRTGVAGRAAVLEVADTGTGVAPEISERIFEPFFTTKEQGNGLGLSTVFGIVKQSGGEVRLVPTDQRGALFRVELPLMSGAETNERRPAAARGPSRIMSRPSRETILLVEDDPSVASFMVRVLHDEGYRVHRAHDGLEALDLVRKEDLAFDLVLTDVVMPNMGGVELVRRLQETHPQLNVLFASGYTDEALLKGGLDPASIDFMKKPFSASELAERVRRALCS